MEYEDIFEKANELINCLGLVDSQDFIEYIISNVGSNGFCSSVFDKLKVDQKFN